MIAQGWTQARFSGITAGEAPQRARVRGTTPPPCSGLCSALCSGTNARKIRHLTPTHYSTTQTRPLVCDPARARMRERVYACSSVVGRLYLTEIKGKKATTEATTEATTARGCSALRKGGGFSA